MDVVFFGASGVGKSFLLSNCIPPHHGVHGVHDASVVSLGLQFQPADPAAPARFAEAPSTTNMPYMAMALRDLRETRADGRRLKVVFVVILEDGSMRPQDLEEMKMLEVINRAAGATQETSGFSILVNQCPAMTAAELGASPANHILKRAPVHYIPKLSHAGELDAKAKAKLQKFLGIESPSPAAPTSSTGTPTSSLGTPTSSPGTPTSSRRSSSQPTGPRRSASKAGLKEVRRADAVEIVKSRLKTAATMKCNRPSPREEKVKGEATSKADSQEKLELDVAAKLLESREAMRRLDAELAEREEALRQRLKSPTPDPKVNDPIPMAPAMPASLACRGYPKASSHMLNADDGSSPTSSGYHSPEARTQPQRSRGTSTRTPFCEDRLARGGARHAAGIRPSSSYKPIKDFAKTVTPNGTAKEVFQNEVVPAFPNLGGWSRPGFGEYLSNEAIRVATDKLQNVDCGSLEPPHVFAVVLYTLDVRNGGGTQKQNFYDALNKALQKRDMGLIQKIEGYLHYLMGALERVPAEPEQIYFRGVPMSCYDVVKKHYTCGRRVHWSGISSVSVDYDVALDFALEEGEGMIDEGGAGGVVFHIRARTGRKIDHLSAIENESEVLLLPNFAGVVSRSLYRDGDVYSVDIVEVAEEKTTFVF